MSTVSCAPLTARGSSTGAAGPWRLCCLLCAPAPQAAGRSGALTPAPPAGWCPSCSCAPETPAGRRRQTATPTPGSCPAGDVVVCAPLWDVGGRTVLCVTAGRVAKGGEVLVGAMISLPADVQKMPPAVAHGRYGRPGAASHPAAPAPPPPLQPGAGCSGSAAPACCRRTCRVVTRRMSD